jgi:tetratricopeptide (TPR) repeat protein
MAHFDPRGNPCSSASASARDAAEQALWRMMSFYGTPLEDLDRASAADESWCLPHAMRAGFLLGLNEPAMALQAQAPLAQAQALAQHATARERAHVQAVQALAEGRWALACRIWGDLLLDHPRDALALQWAQLWDFYCGDTIGLRQRPARALPEWSADDPLLPYVLALHAFGLEENNLYPQAEESARRALALNRRVPWAIHAVAHVMEMQGRFEDGSTWLRQQQPVWAEENGFAVHLWWHKTLFRLEAMDTAGALRLVDTHLSGDALQVTLQRVDAASVLWRLLLLGEDVAERCAALVAGWDVSDGAAHGRPQSDKSANNANNAHSTSGHYAFNDLHLVLALLGAGELARAEACVARCAERALQATDAVRSNHLMAREVGLPLMRGLLAFARGNFDGACDSIAPVRAAAQRLGGSHAQRDVIDQTLLAAAAQGGRHSLGRALLNERCMAKPASPLTRHWLDRLAPSPLTRA